MRRRRSGSFFAVFVLLGEAWASAGMAGCGADSPPDGAATPAPPVEAPDPAPVPTSVESSQAPSGEAAVGEATGSPAAVEAPEGSADTPDGATSSPDALPEPETPPSPADPIPGPCRIQWSNGAIVRFEYTDTAAKVRADHDKDGTPDVCARVEGVDGPPKKIHVDEDCDGKTEFTLTPRYDRKINLATASIKRAGVSSVLTLVTLPTYLGLQPGYPLHGARANIDLQISGGRVRRATLKSPLEGPPVDVRFAYEGDKLIQISEDLGIDGTFDRVLSLTYDASGNVTKLRTELGTTDARTYSEARIDYGCHDG